MAYDYDQAVNAINAYSAATGLRGGEQDAAQYIGKQVSPVAEVRSALAQVRELTGYVDSVVAKLVGPLPPANVEKSSPEDQHQGVFGDLAADARLTARMVQSAMSTLKRLESRLP